MNFKSLLFLLCLSFGSTVFAGDHYFHASANKNTLSPGACDIEIINDCFSDINVYGRFDDGSYLAPFVIPHWGVPQYVSLFYYGTCHAGMDFYIETADGQHKYNGFTPVGKTIKITNFN